MAVSRIFLLTIVLTLSQARTITKWYERPYVCIMDEDQSQEATVQPNFHENPWVVKNDELWNDWQVETSRVPVLDDRWKDLKTTEGFYKGFDITSQLSFSIYNSSPKITFIMDGWVYSDIKEVEIENPSSWNHFLIVSKHGNMQLFQLKECSWDQIWEIEDLYIQKVLVKSSKNAFWKVHDRNVRTTKKVSSEPTRLNFQDVETSCVRIYTSLCPHCSLDVQIDDSVHTFEGGRTSHHLTHSWQQKKFVTNFATNIILKRKAKNENGGHWEVDIVPCFEEKGEQQQYVQESTDVKATSASTKQKIQVVLLTGLLMMLLA